MLGSLPKAKVPGSGESLLELLAHYELVDPGTGRARSGFAVILALESAELYLESDVRFEPGQELGLRFFLPGTKVSNRVNVALGCVVDRCEDPDQLRYSVRVVKSSAAAKTAIETFLSAEKSA